MPKYFCFLVDMETGQIDINHPTEINAKDKAEANSFLLENVPQEYIHSILSVSEFNAKFNTNIKEQSEQSMQMQEQIVNNVNSQIYTDKASNCSAQVNNVLQQTIFTDTTTKTESLPTYFEDDGIQFKLENGVLYKKTWETITLNTDEYRCVNKNTKKEVQLPDKYQIQHFCWKSIKTV